MLELCEAHRVRFEWVRGHAGNVENERCDVLARTAATSAASGVDEGYEHPVWPEGD
jgi:ribonuclease HI